MVSGDRTIYRFMKGSATARNSKDKLIYYTKQFKSESEYVHGAHNAT